MICATLDDVLSSLSLWLSSLSILVLECSDGISIAITVNYFISCGAPSVSQNTNVAGISNLSPPNVNNIAVYTINIQNVFECKLLNSGTIVKAAG